MSDLVLMDDDSNDLREQVAKLRMAGKSDLAVARKLDMKVVEVKAYWQQYKDMLAADAMNRDLASDFLNQTVSHYDHLIDRATNIVDDLDTLAFDHNVAGKKNDVLKTIATFEKDRVDMLQKAGLLDGSDVGDQLAEYEEKFAILLKVLREDLCPACQKVVRDRITALTNVVEGTVID